MANKKLGRPKKEGAVKVRVSVRMYEDLIEDIVKEYGTIQKYIDKCSANFRRRMKRKK